MTLAMLPAMMLAMPTPLAIDQTRKMYTEDLSRCLVEQSSDADKAMVVRWVFASVANSPEVREVSRVTDADRETLHRSMARLFDRLLTRDCRTKAVTAIRNEGGSAIATSFGVLGEVAMQSLINQPAVNSEFEKAGLYMDQAALEALGKEAGVALGKE
ncbi:hypothetical protein ACX0GZ_04115 [Sphingomonas aestuarii]